MLRVGRTLECDDEIVARIVKNSAESVGGLDMEMTPPEAAARLYSEVSRMVGKKDLYTDQKKKSIRKAETMLPFVRERISASDNPLDAALRASAAGNVLDLAAEAEFEIENEIETIFEAEFHPDDKGKFIRRLHSSKRLVVLGDNAGEHCFDKVMIEVFSEMFPRLEIYYFVRGTPIINDVILDEARQIGMDKTAKLINSGVDTPGFLYERACTKAREIYDSADLILSKGMGNFECMDGNGDHRVYFLFKVKCSVVAERIKADIGDLVCMKAG
jgi:uncharacterized protein with ATP-grasp and redox domains